MSAKLTELLDEIDRHLCASSELDQVLADRLAPITHPMAEAITKYEKECSSSPIECLPPALDFARGIASRLASLNARKSILLENLVL